MDLKLLVISSYQGHITEIIVPHEFSHTKTSGLKPTTAMLRA